LSRTVRVLVLLATFALASLFVAPAAPAAAAPAAAASAAAARLRGVTIVAFARAQSGKPYRYGARGPTAFDCSGLTGYAYGRAGIRLPRTAAAQYQAVRPVSKAVARAGDLVFWVSGGRAYHVAVYAGAGQVWHAPKPGDRVKLTRIWGWKQVRFGRVGA
jgi:cell wall-associated NlpC family hydrolase